MLVQGSRPRVLRWFHAGPMLFGDWGTSRLYVLGLAFAFSGHASVWFMAAMSALLVAVGWAYDVICRHFPDGGGVYSAARQRSQSLAVIGGLLLCADYVVTAALSALDAFHYLDLPYPQLWAAAGIALIGVVNSFGPTKAGMVALVVAICTMVLTVIIGAAALPYLGQAHITMPKGTPLHWWSQFTSIILAISGVEAIANMTGIMVQPVAKTARRAIWPVLVEIVLLNMILTFAMQAVPFDVLGDGDASSAFMAHRDDMLKVLAEYYVGPTFAAVAGLVFAALLLSAVNTAITDLVSIQFMLARDRELPGIFGGLNRWGMPVIPLLIGTMVPLATVLLAPDVAVLAELYAIGVVGAIAINVSVCAMNPTLGLKRYEQVGMMALGAVMILVWLTIAYEKPRALVFAASFLGVGLGARWLTHNYASVGRWAISPIQDYLLSRAAILPAAAIVPAESPAPPKTRVTPTQKRILVASRGNPKLLRFAFEYAHSLNAETLILFVRHIAVDVGPARPDDALADVEAQSLEHAAEQLSAEVHVPMRFLYATATDVPETILDIAATYATDILILGASRRGNLWRVMKGDVIQKVAELLPESIKLLIHA